MTSRKVLPREVWEAIIYLQTDVLTPGVSKGLSRLYKYPESVIVPYKKYYTLRYTPQERYDMVYLLTWAQQNIYQMTFEDKSYCINLLSSTGLYTETTCLSSVNLRYNTAKDMFFFPPAIKGKYRIAGNDMPMEASGFLLESLRPDKGIRHKLLIKALELGACPLTVGRIVGMSQTSFRLFAEKGYLGPKALDVEKDLYADYHFGVSGQAPSSHPEHLESSTEVGDTEKLPHSDKDSTLLEFPTCVDYYNNPIKFRREARKWFNFYGLPFVRVQRHIQDCECSQSSKAVASACSTDGGRTIDPKAIRFVLDYPDSTGVDLQVQGDVAQG